VIVRADEQTAARLAEKARDHDRYEPAVWTDQDATDVEALLEELARVTDALREAEGRLRLLGAHDFVGRLDRDCERCGKRDRHPLHSAAYVAALAAGSQEPT
jgi:hypothetical protein